MNVVLGISKYFGEMPWYYYLEFIYNIFCEIETFGFLIFFMLSIRQVFGTLTPASGNGWRPKRSDEVTVKKLTRAPFLLIFFFTNFIVVSSLAHKELRFITTCVQIGNIAAAYMITWCYDTRIVVLQILKRKGLKSNTTIYWFLNWISGFLIKFVAIYIVIKQDRHRIDRYIFQNNYK